ncbi:response regulator [Moritella dasanensis]|uniref:response regulator n=1 Tax=Moritella dasanensis TaxID=428031 RepID=UPI001ED8DB7E|nr:response regulator [Moritella dasanensis]
MINKKRFLVIDDSVVAISLIRWILNGAGVANEFIDSTTDSLKSIRLLSQHRYDVVICDYNMNHHIDGALIFDEAKQRKLIAFDTVFICVTGDSSLSVVTYFIELEPDDYLLKPFCAKEFIHRIEVVLARKKVIAPLLSGMDHQEYQQVLVLCEQFRSTHPQYMTYINRIYGDCLLRLKRHDEALLFYRKSCEESNCIWSEIGLGQTYQSLGDLDKAEDIFNKILTKHPRQPVARQNLAKCMLVRDNLPDAIREFDAVHKINPANPHRELILANLYTALQQHGKAATGFQRFITKVEDTSRYSDGIAMNTYVSLLLASLYTDSSQEQAELISQAQYKIHGYSVLAKGNCVAEFSLLVGLGILAYIHGDIKNALIVIHQIKAIKNQAVDFYTELNIVRLYGLCGVPELYEESVERAQALCKNTNDDILMLSQIKMLEGAKNETQQRLQEGKELTDKAQEQRQDNAGNLAIKYAYKAFQRVPFNYNNCRLIIELTALATPSESRTETSIHERESILKSCDWIYENDNRPTSEEKRCTHELFHQALNKLSVGV